MIKKGAHIHLMGICGTAMASLAGLLKDQGYHITGSDLNPYPPMSTQLESLGITILKGYKKENLIPRPDFVIVGNVISKSNEEAQALLESGIPFTSLPKAMGEFIIQDRECICISGTHGKTTSTSLMSWVASVAETKPGFLIGGIAKNFSKSFQNPEGNLFVIEGDEYDTAFFDKVPKFMHYKPRHVIFTSCEFDHADIYQDFDAVKAAFSNLMNLIPVDGTLLACAEDPAVVELSKRCKALKVKTYAMKKNATRISNITPDYQAETLKVTEAGTEFRVHYFENGQMKSLGDFFITMTGDYNVLNSLAVLGISHQLGWSLGDVSRAFKTFSGIKRRQEVLGEPGGVLVIEDFAHHPTAVRETVKGIKSRYPQRKIHAVFEPRSATSRRRVFQADYVEAFQDCDEIYLAKAFDQNKIAEEDRFSSDELVHDLVKRKKSAAVFSSADEIVSELVKKSKSGELILIMSNGGFDNIYSKIMSRLG